MGNVSSVVQRRFVQTMQSSLRLREETRIPQEVPFRKIIIISEIWILEPSKGESFLSRQSSASNPIHAVHFYRSIPCTRVYEMWIPAPRLNRLPRGR
jgi:hypothetical protein